MTTFQIATVVLGAVSLLALFALVLVALGRE
jgi:hypothetical protein